MARQPCHACISLYGEDLCRDLETDTWSALVYTSTETSLACQEVIRREIPTAGRSPRSAGSCSCDSVRRREARSRACFRHSEGPQSSLMRRIPAGAAAWLALGALCVLPGGPVTTAQTPEKSPGAGAGPGSAAACGAGDRVRARSGGGRRARPGGGRTQDHGADSRHDHRPHPQGAAGPSRDAQKPQPAGTAAGHRHQHIQLQPQGRAPVGGGPGEAPRWVATSRTTVSTRCLFIRNESAA